jgi:hypothetical protein
VIAATWPWVLAGVAFVVVAGLVVMLALGVVGMPADFLRRAGQSATTGRTDRGAAVPEEVPADDAERSRPPPAGDRDAAG